MVGMACRAISPSMPSSSPCPMPSFSPYLSCPCRTPAPCRRPPAPFRRPCAKPAPEAPCHGPRGAHRQPRLARPRLGLHQTSPFYCPERANAFGKITFHYFNRLQFEVAALISRWWWQVVNSVWLQNHRRPTDLISGSFQKAINGWWPGYKGVHKICCATATGGHRENQDRNIVWITRERNITGILLQSTIFLAWALGIK